MVGQRKDRMCACRAYWAGLTGVLAEYWNCGSLSTSRCVPRQWVSRSYRLSPDAVNVRL